MSTTVDNRVVDMQFNNAQFERGASQTLSTLEKLKEGLKFKEGSKGLEEIQNGANRLNFGGIADAIAYTSKRFSLLEIAGITAFTNIVNKGVNVLQSKFKELTFGQVMSGWDKYAEKTSAVQTIMAATAKDFDDTSKHMAYVNGELEKLNWFTDETSFNFLDMVNNIGKFTANQIPLEKSVTAMEGISTWAAVSGANIGEAGRAMYNLSQAIAVGSVKLMDWKSIENANMATAEFKETVIQTALELGTLQKKGDKVFVKGNKKAEVSVKNFNAELAKGWFSSEVLLKSLDKYGAFTNKLYEFSDATGLIASDILDMIDRYRDGSSSLMDIMNELGDTTLTSDQVKKMLDGMTDSSMALGEKAFRAAQEAKTFAEALDSVKDAVSTGWMQTFEYIFGNYEQAKKVWTTVANELYDIFAESGNKRNELLKQWNELGGRDILIDSMRNAWNGFRNVLDLVGESFRNIFPETTVDDLMNFTKKLQSATETFANFVKVRDKKPSEASKIDPKNLIKSHSGGNVFSDGFEEENKAIDATQARLENISKAFEGVFALADILASALGAVVKIIGKFISYLVPAADGIFEISGSFGEWATALRDTLKESDAFNKFVEKVDPAIQRLASVITFLVNILKKAVNIVSGFFKESEETVDSFGDKVEKRYSPIKAFGELLMAIFERLKIIVGPIQNLIPKAFDSIGEALNKLHQNIISTIKNGEFSNVLDVISTGFFALAVKKLYDFTSKFKSVGDELLDVKNKVVETLKSLLESFAPKKGGLDREMADNLLKVAGAIGVLALSLFFLSSIDSDKLLMATLSLMALVGAVGFILDKLGKNKDVKEFKKWSDAIGTFGDTIAQAKKIDSLTSGLLKVAIAIGIMAASVIALASLSWEEIFKGIVGVIALTGTMLAVAYALTKMDKKMVKGLSGLVMMAVAVKVLTSAVKELSQINSEENPEGLMTGMGGVLMLIGALALFTRVAGKVNVGTGVALIGIAASMMVLIQAVKSFSQMDNSDLNKGIGGITALFAVIGIFAALMSSKYVKGGKLLVVANSLLVMSVAMVILGAVVKTLGTLQTDQLIKGLAAIAGCLLAMSVASVIISQGGVGGAASILAFSLAFIALAASLKIIASIPVEALVASIAAFTAILSIISIAGAVISPAIAGTILLISAAFLVFGLGLITVSAGLTSFSVALVAFATSLPVAGIAIVNGIYGIVDSILNVIGSLASKIAIIAVVVLASFLGAVAGNIGIIVASAILIVVNFLNGIISMLPVIVETLLRLVITIIVTTAQAIDTYAPAIMYAIWALLKSIWNLLIEAVAIMLEAIPVFGDMAADKVRGWKANVDDAAGKAFSGLPEAAEDSMDKANKSVNSGSESITDILYSKGPALKEGGAYMTEMLGDGMVDIDSIMKERGIEGYESYISVLRDPGAKEAKDAGEEIKDETADGMKSEKDFKDAGSFDINGFIDGILSRKAAAMAASSSIAAVSLKAMKTTLAEKSPSKITRGFGVNVVLGYVQGIMNKAKLAGEAGADLAKASISSISRAISSASDIFSQEVDASPVITPVISLDGVQQGVGVLNGMLNNRSYAFATSASVSFDRNRMSQLERETMATTALNDALKSVNDKLDELNNSGQFHFEMPVNLNGREIARGTAEYTREELNRLDRINSRKGGRL